MKDVDIELIKKVIEDKEYEELNNYIDAMVEKRLLYLLRNDNICDKIDICIKAIIEKTITSSVEKQVKNFKFSDDYIKTLIDEEGRRLDKLESLEKIDYGSIPVPKADPAKKDKAEPEAEVEDSIFGKIDLPDGPDEFK